MYILKFQYDFTLEHQTLIWVQEKQKKRENDLKARKERIVQYEEEKARKAKEEEERLQKLKEEEEERLRLQKEEEERLLKAKLEEEELLRQKEEEEAAEAARLKEAEESKISKEKESRSSSEETEEGDAPVTASENTESEESRRNSIEPTETQDHDLPSQKIANLSLKETELNKEQDQNNEADINIPDNSVPNTLEANRQNYGATTSSYAHSPGSNCVQYQMSAHNLTYQVANPSYVNNMPTTTVPSQKQTYPNMLTPIQIQSKQAKSNSSCKNISDINFADFEGDANDPFNNAALKSINDMEELALVLQPSTVERNQTNVTNKDQKMNINGQIQFNGMNQYAYYQQVRNNVPQNYNNHYSHQIKNSVPSSASSTVPSCNSNYNVNMSNSFNPTYSYQPQQQSWNNTYMPSRSEERTPNPFDSYSYNINSSTNPSTLPPTTTAAPRANILHNSVSPNSTLPQVTSSHNAMTHQLNQRPDLEDFYSKYYMNKKYNNSTNQSEPKQGENGSSSTLRSCRSVPDLTQEDDAEVSQLNQQVYDNNSSYRGYSHTPPPRPSSTGLTGLEVKFLADENHYSTSTINS